MTTVRLENDTVGEVENAKIGETVTITLHDENGNETEETGKVVEIF